MDATDIFTDMLGGRTKPAIQRQPEDTMPTRPETTDGENEDENLKVQNEALQIAVDELAEEKLLSINKENALISKIKSLQKEKQRAEARAITLSVLLAGTRMTHLAELEEVRRNCDAEKAAKEADERAEKAEKTIEKLRKEKQEALDNLQRVEMMAPSSYAVLLDKPDAFSEKFVGEIREHVIEAIADGLKTAERSGRDRCARILEAVLGTNIPIGYLKTYRRKMRAVINNASAPLSKETVSELERIGFFHNEGKDVHKFDWNGAKTYVAKNQTDAIAFKSNLVDIMKKAF